MYKTATTTPGNIERSRIQEHSSTRAAHVFIMWFLHRLSSHIYLLIWCCTQHMLICLLLSHGYVAVSHCTLVLDRGSTFSAVLRRSRALKQPEWFSRTRTSVHFTFKFALYLAAYTNFIDLSFPLLWYLNYKCPSCYSWNITQILVCNISFPINTNIF